MSTQSKSKTSDGRQRTSLRKDPGRWFLELFVIIAVVVGIAFLVQAFIVKPFRIPSASMYPTLKIGQRVLVDRIGTWFASPSVGDIVVFHPPQGGARRSQQGHRLPPVCGQTPAAGAVCDEPTPKKSDEYYVKRIIAGPGDRIRLLNGQLFRNGKRIKEKYAQACSTDGGLSRCNFPREVTIPKGHYFMMGDNRPDSEDSRFWGPVPESWIIGEVFATYWPPGEIGGI